MNNRRGPMPKTVKSWWWIALALVLVGTATLGHYAQPARAQTPRVTVEFWHGLAMPLGGILEKIATDFNESQTQYQVNPTFKDSYPETMVAAIAAFRAGNAPHIVQMFEVGTATMMSARGAIKPVHELMREAGVAFDSAAYLPAVAGYYSLPDGRMMAMPFNSSTTIMFYNKDAFKKAGLDPNKPPQTWTELREAAKKIRATNAAPCGFTTAWPTWAQFEQFSAIHNVPLATKANGLGGLDAELKINSPLHVRHVQTLVDMQKEGSFKYGGRDAAGDALFPSGECAIIHASSGLRARIAREAKFEWGATMLPYYPHPDHRELEGPAARQHAGDPEHHPGRVGEGVPGAADGAAGARQRGAAGERGPAELRAGEPLVGRERTRPLTGHAAPGRLRRQGPALPAPGAAAPDHDRLLLLAGRAGGLLFVPPAGRLRPAAELRLVR